MGCKRDYAPISLIVVFDRSQENVKSVERLLIKWIIFCAPMSPMALWNIFIDKVERFLRLAKGDKRDCAPSLPIFVFRISN